MKKPKNDNLTIRKKRAKIVLRELKKLFPDATMMLKFRNNFELFVAVVLSAQCTDKMVNRVTEKLFKNYKTVDDYVNADRKEFEKNIKPAGLFRNKAKNILAAAKVVKRKYKGKMPRTMKEMLTLPGVRRKTANVILGNAYGVVEGIAVDTHVRRLSRKFGLTNHRDPKKIEQDLMKLFPKREWFLLTYRMIEYGRHYSPAQKKDDFGNTISQALKGLK